MSQPSVVHIIDHLGIGGAQRVVADLVKRQASGSRRVAVICLRGSTPLSTTIAATGARVFCLGRSKWDPRQLTDLIDLLRALRPAVAHLHLVGAQSLGRAAAMVATVPALVVHDHEASAEIYTHPGPLLALRRLLEPAAPPRQVAYLVLSADAATYATTVRRLPAEQLVVVPNGVDVEHLDGCQLDRTAARRKLGLPEEGLLVVSAGRLSPVKGFDVLVEAAALLPSSLQVAIAGEGPHYGTLEAHVAEQGVTRRFHLLGRLDDLRPLLRAGDLYVQPSRREAFGLAAAEAAACGLPVVASAVGGMREIVRHGETGLLAPPERPAALAAALMRLTTDLALAARMGKAGQTHVREQFSIDRMVEQIEQIYAGLLEPQPPCLTTTSGVTSR